MSFAESVMDEIKNETPAAAEAVVEEKPQQEETPVENKSEEWSHEAPAEWSKPGEPITSKEDDKPADKDEEQPKEEPTEEQPKEQPAEPQPKPDLSKLSKEEKASHAFQKQLSKQKAKYESSIDEIKKQFQSQIEDVKKQLESKKADEPVKKRDDFESDDEYIDYLTQRGVDKRMAQIDADNAKARAEQEAKDKAEAEAAEQQKQVAEYFNTNAKQTFGEGYAEFESRVQKGVANGLAEVLDEAPAVRDYIFSNPNGPAVLNEMLISKDTFVRIMRLASNPMDALLECHELARELSGYKKAEYKKAEPTPAPKMPSLGKPGAGGSTRTAPDMYHDDASLIDFVRRHR
jgi:hypothetical protein